MGTRPWMSGPPQSRAPVCSVHFPAKEGSSSGGVEGRAGRWSWESAGAFSCGREDRRGPASQTVPAQGHLALAEVPAGAQSVVLGAGARAAEQQRLLLQEALAAGLGEGRVQVVHL